MRSRWLIALLLACHALVAHGVRVSHDGAGQVLLYPYYTVRDSPQGGAAFNTLLSIVNGSNRGKVVKVRFREASAGAVVFEANVFLSVRDVWTAAVIPWASGAALVSRDATCALPGVQPSSDGAPATGGIFTPAAYAGDPLGPAADRVREGFVEVLEMGTVRQGTALDRATVHIAGAATCALPQSDADILGDLDPPSGRLYGSATVINVQEGTSYGYDAVALDQWGARAMYGRVGAGPTLADANPFVSAVIDRGQVFISSWSTGIDAVNAVLSANGVEVEFMRESAVAGATDIALSMPTKPLLVDSTRALAPFTTTLSSDGACEIVEDRTLDRDERVYDPLATSFPELIPHGALCWATTVHSLNVHWPDSTPVLGSHAGLRHVILRDFFTPQPSAMQSGVQLLAIDQAVAARFMVAPGATTVIDLATGSVASRQGVTYLGLPVAGTSFVRYVNGGLTINGSTVLSNYGTTSPIKTTRGITTR
jgi:hypothetical protein